MLKLRHDEAITIIYRAVHLWSINKEGKTQKREKNKMIQQQIKKNQEVRAKRYKQQRRSGREHRTNRQQRQREDQEKEETNTYDDTLKI